MWKWLICRIFKCSDEQLEEQVKVTNAQLNVCRDAREMLWNSNKELNQEIKDLNNQNESLKDEIFLLNKQLAENPTDVPSARITYSRPILIGKNTWTHAEIDVRLFIAPDFYIEEKLKENEYVYDGTQYLDTLIPKIYDLAKENYKYGYDNAYGFSEYWMFPFELRKCRAKGKAGDCDDWSIKIGSYFAAANIPRDRWFVSAGVTRSGFGHATIYVRDSSGCWRHMNSTSGKTHNDLKDFPSKNDTKDSIGIDPEQFWFSFNDLFSIHRFETGRAREGFAMEGLPIRIRLAK